MVSRNANMVILTRRTMCRKVDALNCLLLIRHLALITGGVVWYGRRLWCLSRISWWRRRR